MPSDAGVVTRYINGFAPERIEAEFTLRARGVELPVQQRSNWQQALGASDSVLVVQSNYRDPTLRALSAGITQSRALPGHRIYRVERLGERAATDALLQRLAAIAHQDPLCLRVIVEVFEADAAARLRIEQRLASAGFLRSPSWRRYPLTLALDLRGDVDEIFARIHSTARRHIRAITKRGFELREITNPAHGAQLSSLTRAAFARTGGMVDTKPWERIIELSSESTSTSRVVGLFDPRADAAQSMIGFAWACAHGSYVSYEAGGSVRRSSLGSLPLGYAPMWDLIAWARTHTSATWFDLGGISADADDARAGISRFKRYFSEDAVAVGDEWRFEPHPIRGALARAIGTAASWVARRNPPSQAADD